MLGGRTGFGLTVCSTSFLKLKSWWKGWWPNGVRLNSLIHFVSQTEVVVERLVDQDPVCGNQKFNFLSGDF